MPRAMPTDRPVVALLAVGLCLALVACSPTTRYRVLSFVFDGVPPPPGMAVEPRVTDTSDRTSTSFRAAMQTLREEAPRSPPPPAIQSVHQPYQERKCSECHDMSLPIQTIPTDATLCDRCHIDQRHEEGWDHGPINIGSCVPCHVPHASVHERLLATPLPDLCLACHVDTAPGDYEYHEVSNFNDCVACHDPHRMY